MEDLQPAELLSEQLFEIFVDPVAGTDEAAGDHEVAGTGEVAANREAIASSAPRERIGSRAQPFKTLSYALQQAASGAVIYLQPGCYDAAQGERFPLQIPPGVTVVGDVPTRGNETAIVGGGDWRSAAFGRQNVALVLAEMAQIRGVTVTNSHPKGTGIWIEAAAVTIAHCRISHCGREGIFVTGEATPTILNCWLLHNRASGITFTRYAKGEIQRSLLSQNRFGLTLSDFAAPLICQSEITENQVGMVLSGASRPVLRENRVAANAGEGLVVFSQAAPDLGDRQSPGGNYFQDNGELAIRNVGSQSVIAAGNLLSFQAVRGAIEFRACQPVQTGGWEAAREMPPQRTELPDPAPSNPPLGLPHTPPDLVQHWSLPFVAEMLDRRIMGCFADGTFQPDRPISRAQFAALVVRAFQSPGASGKGTVADSDRRFRDVPADHWAAESIAQAVRMGFVEREADALFCPEQPLARWQAIVGLVKGLKLSGGDPDLLHFRDRAEIPSLALSAVTTALAHRLLVLPQSHRLSPLLPVTRAEVAAWIYQALQSGAEAKEVPTVQQDGGDNAIAINSALQVPRLTAVGERLQVAIDLGCNLGCDRATDPAQAEESASPDPIGFWVAAQIAERLEQAGVAATLIQGVQSDDRPIDPAKKLTVLQQLQPDLLLQLRLVAVSSAELSATPSEGEPFEKELSRLGIQTQYAPPESQPFAELLHQTLLTSLDLPDRKVIPLQELPYPLTVPILSVELGLLAEMLSRPNEIDRSFCTYLAETIQRGLLQFLLV